jgi:hypothetical protein
MLVVADSVFDQNGIERKNLTRTATEHWAQAEKNASPATNYQVGQTPTFPGYAPSIGGSGYGGRHGGALDPATAVTGVLLALYGLSRKRREQGA